MRREGTAEFLNRQIAERFSPAARERMEEHKGNRVVKMRDRIATGQREAERSLHRHAEILREREITLDGVRLPIDRGDPIVKPTRSFARVTHSVKFSRTTCPPDQRATQQALEIERD